jgi:hypothetical protein
MDAEPPGKAIRVCDAVRFDVKRCGGTAFIKLRSYRVGERRAMNVMVSRTATLDPTRTDGCNAWTLTPSVHGP